MWKPLNELGISKFLNLMSMILMALSLFCGFAKVMASNDAEASAQKTAELVQSKTRAAQLNRTPQAAHAFQITPLPKALQSAQLHSVAQNAAHANAGAGSAAAASSSHTSAANYQIFKLQDESGKPVRPSTIVQAGDSLYLLGDDCLWQLPGVVGTQKEAKPLTLKKLPVPNNKLKGVPVQEFLAATYYPLHKSIAVLDKSGSVFEYLPERGNWNLMRANKQTLGSPDPHYVSIASDGMHVLLLDPERNQIWRFPAARSDERYFRDVLPWRIKPGDPNVADGVAIGFNGQTLVLRRSGAISEYAPSSKGGNGSPKRFLFKGPHGIQPSRMAVSTQGPIYIIERENNRVLAVDRKTGAWNQFLFPANSDLRGMMPGYGGFCIIDGDSLVFRMLKDFDPHSANAHPRVLDSRLYALHSPVKGASIPRHPGVFPGARRLYRHGVHQGLDFFYDSGSGANVYVNTPAIASASGRVIRADVNYKDMDARTYSRIMSECARDQFCSEANEDLFRGCQVWIDHGNGLITRYAHLNKARPDLRVGMHVQTGEVVGYIGFSGTGENAAGRVKHPHLHFEIWLDGHYLGYGLTPSETISMYQKLFLHRNKSHSSH